MTITQKDRDAYRYALEDSGVPEVIAFMAARNLDGENTFSNRSTASFMIGLGFMWDDTKERADFWYAIYLETIEVCK